MKGRLIGEHLIVQRKRGRTELFFRGTSITVADVLDQVAENRPRHEIIQHHQGALTAEGIAEAVRLAGEVFLEHARVPPKDVRDAPPTSYGEYLVADPAICHGTPTFRGTRLFVADALEFVASGKDWGAIVWEFHGSIVYAAIAEAIRVASGALRDHADDYALEPASA